MAKIEKSARKLHKTKQQVYADAMVKFRQSLTPTPQVFYPRKQLLMKWLRAGGSKKSFTILGLKKVNEMLKQRGKI